MWILYVIVGLAVLGVAVFLITTTVRKKKASPNQNQLSELKSLKEQGLITEQDYDTKVAELKARKGGKNE